MDELINLVTEKLEFVTARITLKEIGKSLKKFKPIEKKKNEQKKFFMFNFVLFFLVFQVPKL